MARELYLNLKNGLPAILDFFFSSSNLLCHVTSESFYFQEKKKFHPSSPLPFSFPNGKIQALQ